MTSLLVVKEKIMGFYKNFEVLVKIIAKFILAYFAFSFVNTELGYLEALTGITPTLFLSAVCAIVPVSVFVLLFALVVVLHLYKLSAVLSVIALVVFLLFYLIYLKFAPNQGILIILYPVLAQFNLHFMLPLIGAMAFNPFAAIPVAFGVIFVKVLEYLKDAASLGNTGADVQGIMTSYQYIFDNLLQDKEMIAYIVVFTVVIVAVYAISRLSINYSWYIAIVVGTIINVAGLAVMGADVKGISIGMVLVGSILGGILAAIIVCKVEKVNIRNLLDIGGMSLLIGQGIGRWGNFTNQEAFGVNTDMPWGMWSPKVYNYIVNNQAEFSANGFSVDPNKFVHPTFLYESLWCLLGVLVLYVITTKFRKFSGQTFLCYGIWYGLERMVVEGLRTDSLYIAGTTIRVSQALSAALVVVCAVLLIVLLIKYTKNPKPIEGIDYFSELELQKASATSAEDIKTEETVETETNSVKTE